MAIFDLDVTLTRYDTFLPFVIGYVRWRPRHWPGLIVRAMRFLVFWRWGRRTWVKETVLRSFLGGEPRARVELRARRYAQRLAESALREQGLHRLRGHQKDGDRVILATASLDVYVQPLAELLGIDEVISSRVRWNERGRLAGFDGENCREWEKLKRVRAALDGPGTGAGVTVYSDSSADLPLLSWAEVGVAVRPSQRLRHQVGGLGLQVENW